MRSEMKKWAIASVVGALGVLGLGGVAGGCFELKYEEEPVVPILGAEDGADAGVVPGEYIIVFKRNFAAEMNAVLERVTASGGVIKSDYRPLLPAFAARLPDDVLKQLVLVDAIDYIEVNRIIRPTSVQSCTPSWGLDRIDQQSLPLNNAYVTTDSAGDGVDIYVFDTGIEPLNPEFENRVFGGYDAVDDPTDPNYGIALDCDGHGTHVAAVVAGKTFGVAKNARLFGVRVFKCPTGSCSPEAWLTAVGNGIKQVNTLINSQTPPRPSIIVLNHEETGTSNFINDMIDSQTQAAPAPLYVLSAGNKSEDACSRWYGDTASKQKKSTIAPFSIVVGASTPNDTRAGFSNYGRCIDLFAPGVGIRSAFTSTLSCHGGSEGVLSGTSQAAAHVAGVAARLWAEHPTSTSTEIQTMVLNSITTGNIDANDNSPNHFLFANSGMEGLPIKACNTGTSPCLSTDGFKCCDGVTQCNRSIVCNGGQCEDCGFEGGRCCQDLDGQPGGDCGSDLTCDTNGFCHCGGPGQKCCGGPGGSCAQGFACDNNLCGGCGIGGKPCCNGTDCVSGFACNGSNQCVTCGGANEPCCNGLACESATECIGGSCIPCGGLNENCCGGADCSNGLGCDATGTCQVCGGAGQPCCNGTCGAGAECNGTSCVACGGSTQPCCGGTVCGGTLVCTGGACQAPACGAGDQPCCDGQVCDGNMGCVNGRCQGKCEAICRDGTWIESHKKGEHGTHADCNQWALDSCTNYVYSPDVYRTYYNGTVIGGDGDCRQNGKACCVDTDPPCGDGLVCYKHKNNPNYPRQWHQGEDGWWTEVKWWSCGPAPGP